MEVPQLNLLTKVDQLIKAEKKDKLDMPFNYYADLGSIHEMVDHRKTEDDDIRHHKVICELALLNDNYGLVNFMPCTLIDPRFLQLILYQAERALGYFSENPDEDFKLVNTVLRISQTEAEMQRAIDDLLERCHKKHAKQKKTSTATVSPTGSGPAVEIA